MQSGQEEFEIRTLRAAPASIRVSDVLKIEIMERRGHAFARYADDCNICVATRRAAKRVPRGSRSAFGIACG